MVNLLWVNNIQRKYSVLGNLLKAILLDVCFVKTYIKVCMNSKYADHTA